MVDAFFVKPDLGFIRDLIMLGGADVKKCYQCATCSVACPISPNLKPFPRKEMIAASWGLKEKLIGNGDVWLCHNCGDCSSLCPRGAKPGDVLSVIRIMNISEYARPKILVDVVNNPSKLPLLLGIPVLIFVFMGLFFKLLGVNWLNLTPQGEQLWQADFISNYLVDIIMIPTLFFSIIVFALSVKRFLFDIHANAIAEKLIYRDKIDFVLFFKTFISIIPNILKHRKFNDCGDNSDRSTPHMMILFSFIALFIVTQCFFAAEWVFHIEGPYSQINPIKWLGNVAGVAMVVGGVILLKNRLGADQKNNYTDWFLIVLILSLGLTGLITEMLRLGGAYYFSAIVYFLHLISVWCLFAYTPFSKLAHLVYRIIAMTYQEYSLRK